MTVQIGFITHHVALAEPLLGMQGAGWLVSATGLTAFLGRMILATIVDRVNVRLLACLIMLAQTVALAALAERKACLLANHGLIVLGETLKATLALAVEVEGLCEQYWRAKQVGTPRLLDCEEMQNVLSKFKNYKSR